MLFLERSAPGSPRTGLGQGGLGPVEGLGLRVAGLGFRAWGLRV